MLSIPFEELAGSPALSINQQTTTAVRTFRVAWDDWPAFARLLVGRYRRVGCSHEFVPPLPFPGDPNLIVSDIDIEPFDAEGPDGSDVATLTSGTNRYPAAGAKVTAVYESLFDADNRPRDDLPGVPTGTYLTYEADLGFEQFSTPSRRWRWNAPPDYPALAADVEPSLLLPTGDFRLTWHRVAVPPWTAIRNLRGHVNSGTFVGAAAGTVMFLGAKIRREFRFAEGGGFWRIEYQFAERAIPLNGGGVAGWNHYFREQAISGEHWLPIINASNQPPYPNGDLGALFAFGIC